MHILAAFDSFKGSLTAPEACKIAAQAILDIHPNWTVTQLPLTDGGEGFCEILTRSAKGEFFTQEVQNPLGQSIKAKWGKVDLINIHPHARKILNLPPSGFLAIIEMAQASGLNLIPEKSRNLWKASTYGTGQLILAAAENKVDAILLGIGGSATNDLGINALNAINKHPLPPIKIASDVTNPLLGPHGATSTYGPQKGLPLPEIPKMEEHIKHQAQKLCSQFNKDFSITQRPGMGAAGGIAFGLHLAHNAEILPGSALVNTWLGLEAKIAASDIILTGEGHFDPTSIKGKATGLVIQLAQAYKKPIHLFAGLISDNMTLKNGSTYSIKPTDYELVRSLKEGPSLLRHKIQEVVNKQLLIHKNKKI